MNIAFGVFLYLSLIQDSEQFPSQTNGNGRTRRSVIIKYNRFRWPNNEVFYSIATKDPSRVSGVELIQSELEAKTCVKFTRVSHDDSRYKIVVTDVPYAGCYTYPGYLRAQSLGLREKELNLGTLCNNLGVIRHEFQHVLGVIHMQSAFDRDKFIKFHPENVADPKLIPQFKRFRERDSRYFGTHYDFRSNMHYGSDLAAKTGTETMTAYKPSDHKMIDHRNNPRYSFFDMKTINEAYKCGAKCSKQHCKGYVDKFCKCITADHIMFGGTIDNPKWPPINPPMFQPPTRLDTVAKVLSGEIPVIQVKSDLPGQGFLPNCGKDFKACKASLRVYYAKELDQFLVPLMSRQIPPGIYLGNKYLDPASVARLPKAVALRFVDEYGRGWLIFYVPNFKAKRILSP